MVASVSVCLSVRPTDLKFGARIEDHHISDKTEGHRSKVKVTKVKNVKITVFSLVSENIVQGHKGQGHHGQRSRSPRSKVKVIGQCQRL